MQLKHVILILFITARLFSQTISPLINGVFIVNQTKYYDKLSTTPSTLKINNGVAAYFSATPKNDIATTDFVNAGNVKFNEKPLTKATQNFYSDNEITSIDSKNWKVSGHSGVVTNMNFIYNGTLPNFDYSNQLIADTIKKSDTLFVTINNIQNADTIQIRFADDNQLASQHHVAYKAPNYANRYYLPPFIFSPLVVGPRAVVTVEAINYTYQTIGGKQYLFRNIFSFVKNGITLIN